MTSPPAAQIIRKSVTINGHRTSVTLEAAFWEALTKLAQTQNKSINRLITEIDDQRDESTNLSSALRVYILKQLSPTQGHSRAGGNLSAPKEM